MQASYSTVTATLNIISLAVQINHQSSWLFNILHPSFIPLVFHLAISMLKIIIIYIIYFPLKASDNNDNGSGGGDGDDGDDDAFIGVRLTESQRV
jgi:hypothetical protein